MNWFVKPRDSSVVHDQGCSFILSLGSSIERIKVGIDFPYEEKLLAPPASQPASHRDQQTDRYIDTVLPAPSYIVPHIRSLS